MITQPLSQPRPRRAPRRPPRRARRLAAARLAALVLVMLVAGMFYRVTAGEHLPRVLVPSSETYEFPPREDGSAPQYLRRLLPVLKRAIRARLTIELRLRGAAGDAVALERQLQDFAGAQQNILRQISRLEPSPEATPVQREVVKALYFQMQFYRHLAQWLHDDPRHTARDEIADSRLQGCHQALEKASHMAVRAFPGLTSEEKLVIHEHFRALELL